MYFLRLVFFILKEYVGISFMFVFVLEIVSFRFDGCLGRGDRIESLYLLFFKIEELTERILFFFSIRFFLGFWKSIKRLRV